MVEGKVRPDRRQDVWWRLRLLSNDSIVSALSRASFGKIETLTYEEKMLRLAVILQESFDMGFNRPWDRLPPNVQKEWLENAHHINERMKYG